MVKGKEQTLPKRVLWQGAGEVGFKPEHKDVQKLLAAVCVVVPQWSWGLNPELCAYQASLLWEPHPQALGNPLITFYIHTCVVKEISFPSYSIVTKFITNSTPAIQGRQSPY